VIYKTKSGSIRQNRQKAFFPHDPHGLPTLTLSTYMTETAPNSSKAGIVAQASAFYIADKLLQYSQNTLGSVQRL
jgi:hypothetical protein